MRLALSGAAGRIGRVARDTLLADGYALHSSDLAGAPAEVHERERFVPGDLRDTAVVDALLEGCEMLLHFAGTPNEQHSVEQVLENNHRMLYGIYEGARRHGLRRIIFASSTHVVGLYPVGTQVNLATPYAADGFYGLSKVWAEELGRMYWEKHGIETIALRIGTCLMVPPRVPRELATWLGSEDLQQLLRCAVSAGSLGFARVWGISANTRSFFTDVADNPIGFQPRQNAEDHAFEVLSRPVPPDPVGERYLGGHFASRDYTPETQRPRQR
jgi:uronate dehydrogenase